MKKICLMLAVLMVLAVSPCVQAYDDIMLPTEVVEVVKKDGSFTAAYVVTSSTMVAQRIKYSDDIKGVQFPIHGSGKKGTSLTASIVPWNGSYANSIYAKPIGKIVIADSTETFKWVRVMIDDSKDYTDDIMVIFSEASEEKIGIWYGADTGNATQTTYFNGTESTRPIATSIIVDVKPVASETVQTEPRDAYAPIAMADYDYSYGARTSENADAGFDGDLVLATDGQGGDKNTVGYRGNYAGYSKIDFGNQSPKSVTFRYTTYNTCRTEIQVYLDKPGGKKIAETMLHYTPYLRNGYNEVDLQITEKVTGIHDVYVVFGYAPLCLSTMRFSTEEKPLNRFDEEYAEFKPVSESELEYTYSDTWSATDMLGRKLPGYETVGERDPEKEVLMFYWTKDYGTGRVINVNEGARLHPEAVNDGSSPIWDTSNAWNNRYYYNESVYGYASTYDSWMLRKQFELFHAAGIDGLALDMSNTANWSPATTFELLRELHKMKQDGYNVPGITYIHPFALHQWTANTVEDLYNTLYKTGLYSDVWYYWNGKPLLMGNPMSLESRTGGQEIIDFFTFRTCQPNYWEGPRSDLEWPWLEIYPQHGFAPLKNSEYDYEICSVGIAQNANEKKEKVGMNHQDGGIFGRSYTYKDKFANYKQEYSEVYGYNFQEQWDRAFELNTKAIFITGWNEYTSRPADFGVTKNSFTDVFNDEYSRDIEPIKGVLQDAYYYQLVANIRKFKGVSPTPVASAEKTIDLNGDFSQWKDVGPDFIGFKGGTEQRNEEFFGIKQVNTTGRNDIVLSKVARDTENLYFYVETSEDLSPYTDKAWMRLFINTDRKTTGWEGYDYVINRISPTSSKAVLEKNTEEWSWEKVGEVDYTVSGNKMMIAVPRSLLGIGSKVDIEFKWNDNMQTEGNIMDFYANGDTAPVGRFAYRYTESTENDLVIDYTKTEGAYEPSPYAKLVYNNVMALDKNFAIDRGEKVQIDPDNPEVAPRIINNKTMVPLRFLCESMEAQVEWSDETQSATITYMNDRIRVTPGSDKIRVGRENITVQTPPQEIDGRIYIPLRDIVEALGVECYWVDPGVIVVGTEAEKIYTENKDVQEMIKFWYGI